LTTEVLVGMKVRLKITLIRWEVRLISSRKPTIVCLSESTRSRKQVTLISLKID
jgi:hypothetical protein